MSGRGKWPRPSAPTRFWVKVQKRGPGGCWLWTGALGGGGYGAFTADGRQQVAHRFAYELLVAPIPPGLVLDHLCRVRHCVNPAHLEPVTAGENLRRGISANAVKTHCKHGHRYDEANTYRRKNGTRSCRACHLARYRRQRHAA